VSGDGVGQKLAEHGRRIQVYHSQQPREGSERKRTFTPIDPSPVWGVNETVCTTADLLAQTDGKINLAASDGLARFEKVPSNHTTTTTVPSGGCQPYSLPTDAIVFHFAAATPSESPVSNMQMFNEIPNDSTFDGVCNRLLQISSSSSGSNNDNNALSGVNVPTIAVSAPVVSGSPTSTTVLRPKSLWTTGSQTDRFSLKSVHSSLTISPAASGDNQSMRSPNCSIIWPSPALEISIQHRAVMELVDSWINVCSMDLDSSLVMKKETKDFFSKMSSLGPEYRSWSHRLKEKLKLEVFYLLIFVHP